MSVEKINIAIQKAYARIYRYVSPTKLEHAEKLSSLSGNNFFLKREDLQKTHSFKVRGATNFLLENQDEAKQRGVISASAGNHAQGVAFASKSLGIKAVIYMPEITPKIKIDSVLSYGAEVRIVGKTFEESKREALQESEISGALFVSPFDQMEIIAGQGTIAIEILQQANSEIDYIFVPVGGGGLITGVGSYIKFLGLNTKVIAVEADEAQAYGKSFSNNRYITENITASFAEGLAVSSIGKLAYELAREVTQDCVSVDEDQICAAIKDIYSDLRCIVEPSGAASIAGARKYLEEHEIKNSNVVCILSGANMNFDRLRHISDRAEVGDNREKTLLISMPEGAGSLERFLMKLGDTRVTEFRYAYDTSLVANVLIGFESDPARIKDLDFALNSETEYRIKDLSDDPTGTFHARHLIFLNKSIHNKSFVKAKVPENNIFVSSLLKDLSKFNINLVNYRNLGDDYSDIIFSVDMTEGRVDSLSSYLEEKEIIYDVENIQEYFSDFI